MGAMEKANQMTLVGGNRPYYIISVLAAEHSRSLGGIFGYMEYVDANILVFCARRLLMKWRSLLGMM